MIGYLESYAGTQKQTGTTDSGSAKPEGKFVLIPAQNGTLLIKSIAVQELMLPCQAGGNLEEPAEECVNIISGSLDQVLLGSLYSLMNENFINIMTDKNTKATRVVPENCGL